MNVEPAAVQLERLQRWFRTHAASWLDEHGRRPLFQPPATPEAILGLEARLGPLPVELRALLERHDGNKRSAFPLVAEGTTWRLLPVAEIQRAWDLGDRVAETAREIPVRTRGAVEAVWWTPAWIPVAGDGTGDRLCIDRRPPPGGTPGQLVHYRHDDEVRAVLYPSLAAWLSACADAYEAGRYAVVEGSLEPTTG